MGIRAGRQVAPLAAALLLTLAACAQPSADSGNAPATDARLSSIAPAAVTPGPTTATPPATTVITPAPVTAPQSSSTGSASAPAAATVTSGAGEAVSPLPSCSAAGLPTSAHGTLTFAVSNRAGAPWFIGNPSQGGGFEAAVGAAVARQLGFTTDQVKWKAADPADVQAAKVPGADVGLGEFQTPDESGGAVDYSTGYFSVSDSVVARVGTPAAKVTGLPALGKLRVASPATPAAAAGRLGATATTAYSSTAGALAALRRGAVDVAVVPTPVAVTAGTDITVLGQLSRPTEQPPQFGMVLPKDSRLTACVSAAIDQLRVTGALAALVQRWVPAANKPLK